MSDGAALDRLRRDGEGFMTEVSLEYYRAGAGLANSAVLQPLYNKYASVLGEESLAVVLDAYRSAAPGSEAHRSARVMLEWQAEAQSARALAGLEEREIAWEATAGLRLADGRTMDYQRAAIEIGNASDAGERRMIDDARARLVEAELAPLKQERLQREREITEAIGIAGSYNETFEELSGVALRDLAAQCEAFLRDTQAMWDEVYPEVVRSALGIDPAEATRADALAVLRAREFDEFFPGTAMEAAVRRQVREMSIDPDAGGRIRYDVGEREGKRSRAFCAPVRVPDEVYLVLRPHGGQTDWNTLLHELGHALHFAYMRPDLAFEYRWLGDNSITEGYAMLFDHLMQNPAWLMRYSGLGKPRLQGFLRSAGFEELHFIRRYCAKLLYEVQLYGGRTPWRSIPDLYVETLTRATTFRYRTADAFVDVDPRFYSARYLQAWQLQALLSETLVDRYDQDWFRNPRAGPWMMQSLFGEGQRELAGEQARRVSGKELSFAPLIRAIERMLA